MSTEAGSEKQQDAQPVPWEEDAVNPQNWSNLKKCVNLGIVSLLAFITYVFGFMKMRVF
jgi:hypothetical protein